MREAMPELYRFQKKSASDKRRRVVVRNQLTGQGPCSEDQQYAGGAGPHDLEGRVTTDQCCSCRSETGHWHQSRHCSVGGEALVEWPPNRCDAVEGVLVHGIWLNQPVWFGFNSRS